MEVGDRVYYVDQGVITGYGVVFEVTQGELECEATGKIYHGTHLKQRKWVDINPVSFKGFQGFRYISRIRGLEEKLMEAEIFRASRKMQCPKCGWKPKIEDVRLLGFHMEVAHQVPHSVVINVLKKMGLESELYQYGLLGKG